MSTDTDGVGMVEMTRELHALETESRAIDSAIEGAGNASEADELAARKARLPVLLQAAKSRVLRAELAELADEARALDLGLPSLTAAVALEGERMRVVESEARRQIAEQQHRAAGAVAELRAAQSRRRAVEERADSVRAALSSIRSGSTSTTPTRLESERVELVIGPGVLSVESGVG